MPLDNVDLNLLQRILDRINSVHNQVCRFNHRMMELSKKLDKPVVVEKVDEEEHRKKMDEIFEKRKLVDLLEITLVSNSNILNL